MPGFDRTGPEGQGARTGRQMGKCANKDSVDTGKETPPGSELRKGMGRGMGRGVGNASGRAGGRGMGKGAGRGSRRGQGRNSWQN